MVGTGLLWAKGTKWKRPNSNLKRSVCPLQHNERKKGIFHTSKLNTQRKNISSLNGRNLKWSKLNSNRIIHHRFHSFRSQALINRKHSIHALDHKSYFVLILYITVQHSTIEIVKFRFDTKWEYYRFFPVRKARKCQIDK